jgi:RNA polymerase sigma-70 factor (ECF subfamily)
VDASRGIAVADAAPALDIDALYNEHAAFLTRVLVRLVGDGGHADDLLQETFLVAYRKRLAFDGRAAVRTWLYGIAARLAMRHRRGKGRFLRALGRYADEPRERAAPGPALDLERARAAAQVRDALDAIPFKQREVFVLYELEELEGAAIAELLGIPVNTVWTRLHHGRKKFEDVIRRRAAKEGP